jgi:hypothetical protein
MEAVILNNDINQHIADLRAQYQAGDITEAGLATLAAFDVEIARAAGGELMERMGLPNKAHITDGGVWVAVEDKADADHVKSCLRMAGYDNVRTFEGWLRGCSKKQLIVSGSRCSFFSDPQGRSQRLYMMACNMGVTPLYTMAAYGQLVIDLDSEKHALALYQGLKDSGVELIEIVPDDMESVDVWQLRIKAA